MKLLFMGLILLLLLFKNGLLFEVCWLKLFPLLKLFKLLLLIPLLNDWTGEARVKEEDTVFVVSPGSTLLTVPLAKLLILLAPPILFPVITFPWGDPYESCWFCC